MADGDSSVETLTPEAAFALVGNETRAEIVRILNEERGASGPRPVLSFSELYDRFDGVGSSRFNYHLQKLVGSFVERTEEGYRIRPEGAILYRTIRGGTFVREESFAEIDVGLDCYCCGAAVTATYEEGVFTIECSDCEHLYLTSTRIPAGTLDDRRELLARVDQFDRHKLFAFNRGVCPTCADPVEAAFVPATEVPFTDNSGREAYVRRSCTHCGNVDYAPVGKALLQHPDVVAFFREHGTDVGSVPQWELEFAVTDHYVDVRSTDPWEVALRLTRDGETLELVVDEDVSVIDRTRT